MKYRNEDDKCYGVAGMTLSLAIFDAIDLYEDINIDDADNSIGIRFAPEFYFNGDPHLNAKDSWQCTYLHYRVSVGLLIANTMCRKMLLDHGTVSSRLRQQLFDAANEQGSELCQLDPDEVQAIFDQYFEHLVRVFSNPDIGNVIKRLVSELKQRRRFSHAEMEELLQDLKLL